MHIPIFNFTIDGARVEDVRYDISAPPKSRWYIRSEDGLFFGYGATFEEAVEDFARGGDEEEDE